ncbi:MAG: CRISPR-associated endonuclease Cas1 [Polyangiaceae bacterium]|nr:CRISPR-associated endonuclease Cas1 [Polyangiaceae bacterium]
MGAEDRAKESDPPRAKALPLGPVAPMARGLPPELVPARMVNEVLYCERLMYLEWSQSEFADNHFTAEGRFSHRRADAPGGALPPEPQPAPARARDAGPPAAAPKPEPEREPEPEPGTEPKRAKRLKRPIEADGAKDGAKDDDTSDEPEAEPEEPIPYKARSVWLSSEALGLTAKIDIVEGDSTGRVTPIEYKRGHPPDLPERAYLPERAQLCAQVLLLRAHGYSCTDAEIYFAGARQRVPIAIDAALEATTLAAVTRARELATAAALPAPLVDSPKCNGCSLVGICLPDEVNLLRLLEGKPLEALEAPGPDEPQTPSNVDARGVDLAPLLELTPDADPWGLYGKEGAEDLEIRRLHPARDDELPLYVQDQGARIALSGDRLLVTGRKTGRLEARLPNTSQVCLLGNVQITTQALRALLERGIPVSFFSSGGWYYGRATGLDSKNIELRSAQHRAAADPGVCLDLARGFVVSKIKNCRTLLRRNADAPDPVVLFELDQLARKAAAAESLAALLGIEGSAARVYFGAFTGMLKGGAVQAGAFDWNGRNRRPPKDPLNALLSFAYSLLVKDFAVTLGAVGLDAMLGFFHQPRFGRPALALDLMEEFRPLVADSTVLGALNTGVVCEGDFLISPAGVAIHAPARRRLIHAHERRMDQLVSHPVFGYRISYRRVLEVQARLLGRVLLGELAAYPPFRTR